MTVLTPQRRSTAPPAAPSAAGKRRPWASRGHLVAAGLLTLAFVSPIYLTIVNAFKTQGQILAIATHHGFTLKYVQDLPRSVRSLTDHVNRRIYLKRETTLGMHSPRTILLQTLGHVILGHRRPDDFGDFLRQRVEANYFAAAVLIPESTAVKYLQEAKAARDLSVEDLRDVYSVSYEMAAHRFTNLAHRTPTAHRTHPIGHALFSFEGGQAVATELLTTGITALTTRDGRVTIMMPHPERVFRAAQYSWRPSTFKEDAPWMRLFRNAHAHVG